MLYFCFTFIYALLIPFGIQILIINRDLPLKGHNMAIAILIPCFLAMVLLGFLNTRRTDKRPDNITALYFPVFLPMLNYVFFSEIYLIAYLLLPSLFWGFEVLVLSGVTCNFFGVLVLIDIPGLSFWHSIQLMNLFYYIILILGFAVGERYRAFRNETKRKFLGLYGKKIIIVSLCMVLLYVLSECIIDYN